tara:strand:+ start:41 stop:775 length:735 start_codon:yes stop_codon:yes gene_type:complete
MPQKKKTKQANTIHEAKIEVREKVGKIFHDAKQSHRQYSYTSHTAVTAAVVPAMHEVGMTYKFQCSNLQLENGFAIMKMAVEFHYADDNEIDTCIVYCGDKLRDGTTMGSITSYGLKVALLKYFGLESGEKDLEAIQAEHEAVQAATLRQDAVEKTKDIFNGEEVETAPWDIADEYPIEKEQGARGDPEQENHLASLKEFIAIAGNLITPEQLDARLAKDGYSSLDDVPTEVLDQWTDKMKEKN